MLNKCLGKFWILLTLVSLCSLSVHAADFPDQKRTAAVAELKRLSDAWDQAIIRKDRAAIESNMTEDFRQIDGSGDIETKASFVDGLVSDKLVLDPYTVEDFEVRLYDNVALLSGRTQMTGRYDGKPFKSHYRYIDIYIKRNGRWKIVSVQISKIPQQ
ncbi:nuclear transport factor 2 family protein [Undibacterium sp. CY18W]|uniref:Nuclear transport factor 2 family protein n=2 Tax=Undibacterium hunanense TaxID=2762292 RepID=A0ABR6ZWB3_9BURK|nr:nuclear transport factor 2 family protein [Undibacterium hunanense]